MNYAKISKNMKKMLCLILAVVSLVSVFAGCLMTASAAEVDIDTVACEKHASGTNVYRVFGANRFETAFKVADELKQILTVDKFNNVVIASGMDFADALSGSYLASAKNAPMLLAGTYDTFNQQVVEYVKNNVAENGTVYILGGTAAVSDSVDAGLKGFNVKRLAGAHRFETNLLILAEAGVGDKAVMVCTGSNFADSLSASACKMPILLVHNKLTKEQEAFLNSLTGNDLYVIGGTGTVSEDMETKLAEYGKVTRIGGKNRFETSTLIANTFFDNPKDVVLAYAWNYPDGLCGGALAAAMNAPLILTMDKYEAEAERYIDEQGISSAYVTGSSSLISDETVRTIFNLDTSTEITPPVAQGHEHNCAIVLVEPTCTEKGYEEHTCVSCGNVYRVDYIEAVGHDWNEWKTAKGATTTATGLKERTCKNCNAVESVEIPMIKLSEDIVAYYKVVDGKVVDIVSGKTMDGAVVKGNYFSGGKVVLPSSYEKASVEAIMRYNRTSSDLPIGNGFSYYGGAFLFQEAVNPTQVGLIKVPFGGGFTGTNFTLKPSINYDRPVLGDGDSYWCLAFNKNDTTYSLQINNDHFEKAHWSNFISKSFPLSSEHEFKDFIVYSSRLTKEEMTEHFQNTGIELLSEDDAVIGRVTNGITGLGSALAFSKSGTNGIPEWVETNTKAGTYSIDDGNGSVLNYTISDYVEPDNNVDNSKYESVHIIKKPETLYVDYKYALSAVPYPFNINHNGKADQYDVAWTSSDDSIAIVIDGLVIPQKTGVVTVTATLKGTSKSDSCTIEIIAKDSAVDKTLTISANYISKNGNSFSNENYEMTTNAIYDAITEAYEDGYNHIVFPKINFYAAPTDKPYYIPTGMTVEFPEGSEFHMMPNALGKADGYTYFRMGWGWWSCGIPTEKAYAETDENGNILAYYCRDAHLIIDKYFGEFYDENATMAELKTGANEYAWGCVLLDIGKRAEYCSVEIREANCPTGFFITMGGKGNSELVNGQSSSIAADNFVYGWLDDTGALVENKNWISTKDFFMVTKAANGMDTLHEYYIGNWEHNVVVATQRLYDILWYDEDYNLIGANRWQYVDEGYANKPANAKYFKISIQQSELPSGTNEYVRLCPDEATKFCEIKNTNIINGADGLASVVGATEACWIHDNYVSGDSLLNGACWSLDLEDGWMGMRGTVIEHNIFKKYAYSSSIGEYRGMDSGILALASGYNTFVISNYLGSIVQSNGNVTNTHIINNVIYTMYGSISNSVATDIKPKIFAHVYNNIIGDSNIKENTSGNGVVYHHDNTTSEAINKW